MRHDALLLKLTATSGVARMPQKDKNDGMTQARHKMKRRGMPIRHILTQNVTRDTSDL